MATHWATITTAGLFLALFLVLNAFGSLLFDLTFYHQQYQQNGAYDTLGEDEALNATRSLHGFLKDEGSLSDFYTDREKAHMADVKELVDNSASLKWMFLGFGVLLTFFLYFGEPDHAFRRLGQVFLVTGIITVLLFLAGLLLSSSFSSAFLSFHETFFDNDLWMLDPGTDSMLILFPESFFQAFFTRLMVKVLVGGISLGMLGLALLYFVKKGKLQ